MPDEGLTITVEQAKKLAAGTQEIGANVQGVLQHPGFQIFVALFELRKREIKDKEDYDTLELFKADRGAIRIVDGILDEFRSYIDNAETAKLNLEKLIEKLSQTPSDPLLIGGESEQG